MTVHQTFPRQPEGVSGAECAHELVADLRTATVERNDLQRYPWMVRCYGQGRCTIGRGVPNYSSDEMTARRKAAVWIKTGVSPADQREGL